MKPDFDVVIVGGGLAGLTNAIVLAGAGKSVLLLEKHEYPKHKVCGEYVSNEVLSYLQSLGFDPFDFGASRITRLRLSTPSGKNIYSPLDLGAFGLSRFVMDKALADLAERKGATVRTGARVTDIVFTGTAFTVTLGGGDTVTATQVIGAWGKRDTLDKKLDRSFMNQRTGWMAVKYHVKTDYPVDEIGLDNFAGGYCGIGKIEGDLYDVCNFYKRGNKGERLSVSEFEEQVAFKNPVIRNIFRNSDFVLEAPVVINEISFAAKPLVENHILMCGDSAGLITPLCGNGMSMAIGSAKMLSGLLLESGLLDKENPAAADRHNLEKAYRNAWNRQFRKRLFWGRTIQKFFGNPHMSEGFIRGLQLFPAVTRRLIRATHGEPLL